MPATSAPYACRAVAELPQVPAPPELAALERADRVAADRATKADLARQAAFNTLATVSARLEAASTAADTAATRAQARAATLGGLLATLSAAVPGAPAAGTGAAVLDWFEQRRTELLAARSRARPPGSGAAEGRERAGRSGAWRSRTRRATRKPPPSATSNWSRTRRESKRNLPASSRGFTVLPPAPIRGQSVRPSSNVSPGCAMRSTARERRSPSSISR